MQMTHFCPLSLCLSDLSQIVTPKPTTPPPTALNYTHGPTPAATALPTRQPPIAATTKVTVETPAPVGPMAPPTPGPPLPPHTNHTNHSTSAPLPGPTTIRGGGAEEKITPTLRPTTLPISSTTEGPSITTLPTDPGPDNDTTPVSGFYPADPSTTTKPPEITTTPFPGTSGMCAC